ncbi:hypothetical protein BJ912DRAFT_480087 [Pholiota molesta]|nr:hypothetical protein BJ912DRAFT_480087 [Pholiota molesta]
MNQSSDRHRYKSPTKLCLRPCLVLKTILDSVRGILSNNNENAKLRNTDVAHPEAENMTMLSRIQDSECGDVSTRTAGDLHVQSRLLNPGACQRKSPREPTSSRIAQPNSRSPRYFRKDQGSCGSDKNLCC